MSLLDKECAMTEIPENTTFDHLFAKDSTLVSAPELPATELAEDCYRNMFYKSNIETAPYLPATKLPDGCYASMFEGCANLKRIKVAFTKWPNRIPETKKSTNGWVIGVNPGGTFECPEGLEKKYGSSSIPTGWSVTND